MSETNQQPVTAHTAARWLTTTLRRRWLVLSIVAMIIFATGASYVFSRGDEYTASTLVTLRPKGQKPVSAQVVLLTAPRYVAYASAPHTAHMVAKKHHANADQLAAGINVSMAPTTANMQIEVTLSDPHQAATLANALGAAVLERAKSDPILAAELVSTAQTPTKPNGPTRGIQLAGVALLALLAGLGVAIFIQLWPAAKPPTIPAARTATGPARKRSPVVS